MELLDIDERVRAGAAWLDANGPEGWAGKVDLPELDILNTRKCVLGQLYAEEADGEPGYWHVLDNMLPNYAMSREMGFSGTLCDMPLLTEAWRRFILARREELALAA